MNVTLLTKVETVYYVTEANCALQLYRHDFHISVYCALGNSIETCNEETEILAVNTGIR